MEKEFYFKKLFSQAYIITMPNAPVFAKFKMPKKQSRISAPAKKAMTAIAKKVIHREAETQSALGTFVQTTTDDLVYVQNLTYGISQGDGIQNRTGQKIMLKNFYIKGKIQHNNNVSIGQGTTQTRVMIIKTKQPLTTTSVQATATDIFRGSTTNLVSRGLPDLAKVSVMYDKVIQTDTSTNNYTNMHRNITINKKINKTLYYESDSSSYFKTGNYYLLIVTNKTDNSVSLNNGSASFQFAVNFTDL